MKLTTKSEYACLALVDLAKHCQNGFVKAKDIAKRNKIPQKYLEQILMLLQRAGYVKGERGLRGGYRFAKPPNKVSLAQVIRLMDGALAPVGSVSKYFYSHTPIESNKQLLRLFRDIRDYIAKKLENTSFADLAKKKK